MTANKKELGDNAGLGQEKFIRMDEARSSRFLTTLGKVTKANASLATAIQHFNSIDLSTEGGDMCAKTTVAAFTSYMEEQLNLLSLMVSGEENPEAKDAATGKGGVQ